MYYGRNLMADIFRQIHYGRYSVADILRHYCSYLTAYILPQIYHGRYITAGILQKIYYGPQKHTADTFRQNILWQTCYSRYMTANVLWQTYCGRCNMASHYLHYLLFKKLDLDTCLKPKAKSWTGLNCSL